MHWRLVFSVCNLYIITTNQAAILALFRVVNRYIGNLQPMPGVFPDYPAPVIRNAHAGTEMTLMTLGHAAAAQRRPPQVTNIRNTRRRAGRIIAARSDEAT
jgi:putative SOS response-associated peptidase YedK